jgi:hypothetical protein
MDQTQARALLAAERARLERLPAGHPFEVLAEPDISPEEAQATEEDDDEPATAPSLAIHLEI